ncbi:hypothetical protein [Nonomuraea fuscirosea]|uniref:hypothetical protein n=1 Tax=Nonomuraea fuscirosea TaxID=1291556 RepID=UPI00389A7CD5
MRSRLRLLRPAYLRLLGPARTRTVGRLRRLACPVGRPLGQRPGQRLGQRLVALARSLVREPRLLLADEPFGALDALTRLKMHVRLRRLCEQHRPSVLLVTHDVDEAIALADRVLVLEDGRIATEQRLDGGASHAELRTVLLRVLGVTDDDAADRDGSR